MRYQSFSVFGPWGLTPGPKFTRRGDDLVDSDIYQPAKFHHSKPTQARDIRYQNSCGQTEKQTNKQTSTPVVQTDVYPHMPIVVTANSLQHWPSMSKRRPVCHIGPRRSCKFVAPGWRPSNVLSILRFLTLGFYSWVKGHQKGRWPTIHLDLLSYKISVRSRKRCSRYALPKFFQSLALIFDPSWSSKVKSDDANRKPVGPAYKCSLGSNVVSITVLEIFGVKILTVDLLTLAGLTPGPQVTKSGDDLLFT